MSQRFQFSMGRKTAIAALLVVAVFASDRHAASKFHHVPAVFWFVVLVASLAGVLVIALRRTK